jgi:hypothetical protein
VSRLVGFPIQTFAEISRLGLVLEVWCLKCKTSRRPDLAGPAADRCFAGARLRCRHCGGSGYPSIDPPEIIAPDAAIKRAHLFCERCVPPWQMRDVRHDRAPWSALDIAAGERWRCPGCGGEVGWHWQGVPAPGNGIRPGGVSS